MAYAGWKVGEDEKVELLGQKVGKGDVTSPQGPGIHWRVYIPGNV